MEEVWTCGVDRFTQRVKKFESKAILLQTSALSELSPLSSSRKEVRHVASALQLFFLQLNPPELHTLTDWSGKGAGVSQTLLLLR